MTSPTPRKNTRTKPVAAAIDLDLTRVVVEEEDAPLTVRLPSGAVVRLLNVRDVDWQVAAKLDPNRPFEFFSAIVHEDDQDAFFGEKGLTDKHLKPVGDLYFEKFGAELGESGA